MFHSQNGFIHLEVETSKFTFNINNSSIFYNRYASNSKARATMFGGLAQGANSFVAGPGVTGAKIIESIYTTPYVTAISIPP